MKHAFIKTAILAAGVTLAATTFAQGRHDEKPHGSAKPSAEKKEGKPAPMTGGRHDEKPHGTQKPAAKKADAAKSSETEKAGK